MDKQNLYFGLLCTENFVNQVQNRDKIKIKEIKKVGYTPYIIKDMGSSNEEKVEKEFKKFIKWACIQVS